MSAASDLITAGLSLLEGVWGEETFVYGGQHWACLFSERSSPIEPLNPGGFEDTREAVLVVRKNAITPIETADTSEIGSEEPTADQLTMPPRKGAIIICRNLQWEIAKRPTETQSAWHCDLVSPDAP